MIRALLAFPLKEWRIYRSYRFAMLLNLASILFGVGTFFFVGRFLEDGGAPYLATYGGSYFLYALVGIAMSHFLVSLLNGLSINLRQEQDLGTLEAILVSPLPEPLVLLGLLVWNTSLSLLIGVGYVTLGYFIYPFPLSWIAIVKASLAVALAGLVFLGLGGIAASFILYFKRGNPITWIFSSFSIFLGGVYFPVELLPPSLCSFAKLLPIPHAIDALRMALLQDASISMLAPKLLILSLFSLLLLPLAWILIQVSLRRSREQGSLNHQ